MTKTKIEWATDVWNPVTGCTKVSAGCKNCYAETIANRFWGERKFTDVQLHQGRLGEPLHWKKPRRVFVNSMSDLFHEKVPLEFIASLWDVMIETPQHTYMILTKRPERMYRVLEGFKVFARDHPTPYPISNVWLGVSCEDQKAADERIPLLLQTPAAVRFVSVEPMLSAIDLSPYLGYNTQIGESQNETTKRKDTLYPDTEWNMVNRRSGDTSRNQDREVPNTQNPTRLYPGTEDDKRMPNINGSTPSGMDALQRRNTTGDDDKSQEWHQERQSTGEFGVGNILRADTSRNSGFGTASMDVGSEWGKEQAGKVNERAGEGDTGTEGKRGEVVVNSQGLWNSVPDGIKDREKRIAWCIVGGESGPGARPCHPDWVRGLRDQCQVAGVPFFLKQMVIDGKMVKMPELDGKIWDEYPGA